MTDTDFASEPAKPTCRLALAYLVTIVGVMAATQVFAVPPFIVERGSSLIGLSVVAAIVFGIRRFQPHSPTGWYVIALAHGLWVIAGTAATRQSAGPHSTAFPDFSDLFYLLGYPTFAFGIVMLVKDRSRSRRDRGPILDAAIITLGLGLLAWVVLARPMFESMNESLMDAAGAGLYPAMDIVLAAVLIRLLTMSGRPSVSLKMLIASLGLLIAADTVALGSALFSTPTVPGTDLLWLLSYAVCGAAALHPSMGKLSGRTASPTQHFRGARLLALVAASLLAPAILAIEHILDTQSDFWALIAGTSVMSVLVVLRMSTTIQQISSVHQSLEILQDELAVQATHDPMTDMANRTQLLRLVAGTLGRTRRRGGQVGLLFIDLDGFKAVNDTHGHRAGDEVLRQVAARIKDAIRDSDFGGRLGGDEFLVGIENVADENDAVSFAERLIEAISRPIKINDEVTVQVGASIGVALGRGGETNVETLLHEADLAVYAAKTAGRGRVELFSSQARTAHQLRMDLERDLTIAIACCELVLHFQPIVNQSNGHVDCYEALVRWDRPGGPLLDPADFLSIAESSDLIYDLDNWVLQAAVDQMSKWNQQRGDRSLQVAVNISGRHISHPRIMGDVADALQDAAIDASQLVVEITETALMDGTAAEANLVSLRQTGVVISLDDFGTGYQSTAQLSRLPIDKLKIDRQFVIDESTSANSLLELMVKAGHAFGLQVVAEGVETPEQLARVRELGCEYVQGYYYGRPAPPADLRVTPAASRIAG